MVSTTQARRDLTQELYESLSKEELRMLLEELRNAKIADLEEVRGAIRGVRRAAVDLKLQMLTFPDRDFSVQETLLAEEARQLPELRRQEEELERLIATYDFRISGWS
jgi:hypothetical protein